MRGPLDTGGLGMWLTEHVAGFAPPVRIEPLACAASPPLCRAIDAAGRAVVLRVTPPGTASRHAHLVLREHRVLAALVATPVPAPVPLVCCADESVAGAPFLAVEPVDGLFLASSEEAAVVLGERAAQVTVEHLVDRLAELHAVDVDAVGLGDLSRRDDHVLRLLAAGRGRSQRARRRQGRVRASIVDEVHQLLALGIPRQRGTTLVHGAVGQSCALVGPDGSLRCLVGWERAELGDARCDVGLLLARCEWSDRVPAGRPPVELPVAALAERYAAAGAVADDLPWFVALGHWLLACAAVDDGAGSEAEARAELALEQLAG